MAETAVQVRIHGRVQGVFFRGWTEEKARALGLRGWVRNRRDGTVEAVFAGEDAAVTRMIAACHEGPRAAYVVSVVTSEAVPPSEPGFHQKPTV